MGKIELFLEFLKQQKIYLLMVIFVVLCNVIVSISYKGIPERAQPTEVEKEISNLQDRIKREISSPEDFRKLIAKNRFLYIAISLFGLLTFAALGIGVVSSIRYLYAKSKGKELIRPTFEHFGVRWSLLDVVRLVILLVFFGYFFSISEALVGILFEFRISSRELRMLLHTTFTDLLALVIIIYFVTKKYSHRVRSLGLSFKNWLRNVAIGVIGYITLLPTLLLILLLVMNIIELIGYKPPVQPVVGLFFKETRPRLLAYLTVFVAILGPLAEEIFFRGFAYKAFRGAFGIRWALIITSVLFALLHADITGFFPILALGLLLGYLYEKTGSLIPSLTVHILHNGLTVWLIFLIKELSKLS